MKNLARLMDGAVALVFRLTNGEMETLPSTEVKKQNRGMCSKEGRAPGQHRGRRGARSKLSAVDKLKIFDQFNYPFEVDR